MLRQLLLLLLLIGARPSFSQVDPSIEWRVLTSEHFELLYPKGMKELAEEYVYQGERSHYLLKDLFKEMPSKTYVVLMDNTDSANGYANFIPYPHIVIFPVLPDELSSIGYYGSWSFGLMVHEYTHISSFVPAHSFYTPLKWIFGSVVRPNAILPRWFLEGVAVQVESRYSPYGRLKSPGTQAALRALVRDDQLSYNTLDKINQTNISTYPFGRRPYLFGSLLWQSVINEAGLKSVEKLHQSYSRRLPFLLDTPVEELTGSGYSKLLSKIYDQITDLATRQMGMIKAASSMPMRRLIKKADENQAIPKISPDGKHLIYTAAAPFEGRSIQLRSKKSKRKSSFRKGKSKFVLTANGTQRLCWAPDSKRFIYNQAQTEDGFKTVTDLYEYKLSKKESKRLTFGERAREGCYNPSQTEIVYVKIDAANTELRILDRKDLKSRTLFKPGNYERVSSPIFLTDDRVLFVWKKISGEQVLHTISTSGEGEPTPLLEGYDDVLQPRLTKKGLLFTSAKTGVPNIYFSKAPYTKARSLTNTETGMWSADLDPETNEVLVTESTGAGTKLTVVKAKYRKPPTLNKVVPGALTPTGSKEFFEKTQLKINDSSFWGADYLLPRYWIPFVFPIEGGMIFQGSVVGQDPLGINTYFVDGSYDSVSTQTSYGVGYVNRSTPVDWSVSYSEFQDFQPTLDETFTNRFAATSFAFKVPYASFRWRSSIGGRFRESRDPFPPTEGPTTLRGVGPTVGISYANGRDASNAGTQFLGQFAFSLSHTEFLEEGDNFAFGQTRYSFAKSWNSFLPLRHSLTFQTRGSYAPDMTLAQSVSLGDRTLAGNFLVTIINSSFIMRGYPSGAFTGRQLYNSSLQYNFPLVDILKGKSYFPLFFNSITSSIFVDSVALDGLGFNSDTGYFRTRTGTFYMSTGMEFNLNTTLAYHLPLSTTLGLYYGFSDEADGGFIPFITFGYSGHGGVGSSRPGGPNTQGVQNPRNTLF